MEEIEATPILKNSEIFSEINDATFSHLLGAMYKQPLKAGQVLFRQGDNGDSMVVVVEGKLAINYRQADGTMVLIDTAEAGVVLGELSCCDPAPRSAQVEAVEDSLVYVLDRMVLTSLCENAPSVASAIIHGVISLVTSRSLELEQRILDLLAKTQGKKEPVELPRADTKDGGLATRSAKPSQGTPLRQKFNLENVQAPPGLTLKDLEFLSRSGTFMSYEAGRDLCREGEPGSTCFILLEGDLDILRWAHSRNRLLATIQASSILGQMALVSNSPRSATVRARTDVVVLELSRTIFELLLETADPPALRLQLQVAVDGIRQLRRVLLRLDNIEQLRKIWAAPKPLKRPAQREPKQAPQQPPRPLSHQPPPQPPRRRRPVATDEYDWEMDEEERLERQLQKYMASLGEWGITMADLDAVEVVQPEGLMTAAEIKTRLQQG